MPESASTWFLLYTPVSNIVTNLPGIQCLQKVNKFWKNWEQKFGRKQLRKVFWALNEENQTMRKEELKSAKLDSMKQEELKSAPTQKELKAS